MTAGSPRRRRVQPANCGWHHLVDDNLTLVHFAIRSLKVKTTGRGFDYDDVFAAGTEGLIEAAIRFDPSRGIKFSSFALDRIRGAILDFFRRDDILPRLVRAKLRKVEAGRDEMAQLLGRWPSNAELCEHLGMTLDDLHRLLASGGQSVHSLGVSSRAWSNWNSDWEMDQDDSHNPEAHLDDIALAEVVNNALRRLSHRDRMFLAKRYGLSQSLARIADDFGISESGVCQMNGRVIARLIKKMAA